MTDGALPEILPLDLIQALPGPDEAAETVVDVVVPPEVNGHGLKLRATNSPDVEARARAYLAGIPGGVQGQKGSNPTLWAARVLAYGFDLGEHRAFEILASDYNPRCAPPWPDDLLRRKCAEGNKDGFRQPRGWLKDAWQPGMAIETGAAPPQATTPPRGMPGSAERPLEILRLPELLGREFPPPAWAVPGLLSEGLTVLAGKPKLGKSWLALNLGLTIAAGGYALGTTKVVAGDVLYLALEDRWRRIQDRARKVLAGMGAEASGRLHFAVEFPRQDQGGLEAIAAWIKRTADEGGNPTLVIVDVWAKFRPATKGGGRSAYEVDYEQVSGFKAVVDDNRVSALVLHHCKKAKTEDALEEVSGTNGIAGSADGTLVLTRARNENEAELFMTGRDFEEGQLALEFDPKTFVWKSHGKASERTESKGRAAVIEFFRRNAGGIFQVSEIADRLDIRAEGRESFRRMLVRMADAGQIARVRTGVYRWPMDAAEEVL